MGAVGAFGSVGTVGEGDYVVRPISHCSDTIMGSSPPRCCMCGQLEHLEQPRVKVV